jgi:cytoskeleton protein RodZ
MLQRAGVRLQAARESRGLTVEDAARSTRIRAQQLRDLENDDYGNFPNPTYAKSFLTQYAKFLGVDVSQERETFDVSQAHTYSSITRSILPRAEAVTSLGDRRRNKGGPKALWPIAAVGLLAFALLGLFLLKVVLDINRSGSVTEAPAESPPAETRPTQTGTEVTSINPQPERPSVSPSTTGSVEVRRAIPVESGSGEEEELIRSANPSGR